MEEIISLVVANGIFAVLFCGLLVYELRDSRTRESNYTQTIKALSERLKTLSDVKTDTAVIKTDAEDIKSDVQKLCADTGSIKRAVVRSVKNASGGGECASTPA